MSPLVPGTSLAIAAVTLVIVRFLDHFAVGEDGEIQLGGAVDRDGRNAGGLNRSKWRIRIDRRVVRGDRRRVVDRLFDRRRRCARDARGSPAATTTAASDSQSEQYCCAHSNPGFHHFMLLDRTIPIKLGGPAHRAGPSFLQIHILAGRCSKRKCDATSTRARRRPQPHFRVRGTLSQRSNTLPPNNRSTGVAEPNEAPTVMTCAWIFGSRAPSRYKKQLKIALGKLRECGTHSSSSS